MVEYHDAEWVSRRTTIAASSSCSRSKRTGRAELDHQLAQAPGLPSSLRRLRPARWPSSRERDVERLFARSVDRAARAKIESTINERAGIGRRAERVRQLRPVRLGVRRRHTGRQQAGDALARAPHENDRIHCAQPRPQAPRLPLRRLRPPCTRSCKRRASSTTTSSRASGTPEHDRRSCRTRPSATPRPPAAPPRDGDPGRHDRSRSSSRSGARPPRSWFDSQADDLRRPRRSHTIGLRELTALEANAQRRLGVLRARAHATNQALTDLFAAEQAQVDARDTRSTSPTKRSTRTTTLRATSVAAAFQGAGFDALTDLDQRTAVGARRGPRSARRVITSLQEAANDWAPRIPSLRCALGSPASSRSRSQWRGVASLVVSVQAARRRSRRPRTAPSTSSADARANSSSDAQKLTTGTAGRRNRCTSR